ncbi:hypothetical protein KUV89_18030 [Marinobacter hydrocarbonoclasticus]|nr:hypothetical protein [Marinobacter nauticus]
MINTLASPLVIVGGDLVLASVKDALNEQDNESVEPPLGLQCRGPHCDEPVAWDFIPEAQAFRCRIAQGANVGNLAPDPYCAHQDRVDNWQ